MNAVIQEQNSSTADNAWDAVVDVLVVGSGAAGLSAALFAAKKGLTVLVCEKSPRLGGTTARSNGMIWIPCSQQALAARIDDSIDKARNYLKHELANHYREEAIEAFLTDGPTAIATLESGTDVKFVLASAPDYHSSQPGGVDKGRALSPAPYDGRLLGKDFDLVGDPVRVVLGGMMISSGEVGHFLNPLRSRQAFGHVIKRVRRYVADRLSYRRGTELSGGNALIARLLTSLHKRGVEIRHGTRLSRLVICNDRVAGAVLTGAGGEVRVGATRGVVLATGGFAGDPSLREELSGNHRHDETLVHPDATGDGIRLARRIGAGIDRDVESAGFWTPVSLLTKGKSQQTVPYGWLDRGRPGVIAVGPDARRFVNESNSYHDICLGMFANGYPDDRRFYFICDSRFLKKRGMGYLLPWPWTLGIRKYERLGYIQTGATLAELAGKIGLDAQALTATVNDHNEHARTGIDPLFQRGESAFNRTLGDPCVGKPNPNLGPVEQPPFIALRIVPATLGTSVGLATDSHGRVLKDDGNPVAGLFACGNDSTSIMRGIYPGAGITIGPAIVFSYRAIECLGKAPSEDNELSK